MKNMKKLLEFGLINIDKSAGPTSYLVSEFVRRQLGLGKTSHMGTLDPKVTGVLPITLGRACKLAAYFIKHDKSYVGILETHRVCDIVELQKLIDDRFLGRIRQIPPRRSAVKIEEREREVYSWNLIEASEDGKSFLFDCRVEGGTYVRKLCSDLGEMIGGAHMGDLRRTEAGIFDENKMYNLFDFKSAVDKWKNGDEESLRKMIVPAEAAIRKVLPVVEIEKCAVKSLYIGRPLLTTNVVGKVGLKAGDVFAVFCEDVFIGVYRKGDEEAIFGRPEFVFN